MSFLGNAAVRAASRRDGCRRRGASGSEEKVNPQESKLRLLFPFAWRGSNTDVSSVALLYSVEISEVT